MTRTIMKVLASVAILCFCASLSLFVMSWSGIHLPECGLDGRWILLDCAFVLAIIVAIDAHIVSIKEAFAIGIKVGESPHVRIPLDDPHSSDTGPRPMPGYK